MSLGLPFGSNLLIHVSFLGHRDGTLACDWVHGGPARPSRHCAQAPWGGRSRPGQGREPATQNPARRGVFHSLGLHLDHKCEDEMTQKARTATPEP